MSGIKKYRPELRFLAFCRKVQMEIMGKEASSDMRMSEAQLHSAVLKVMGCEPIILDSKLIHMCLDKRSELYGQVPAPMLHRMLCDVHDRINPQPDRAMRKRSENDNQFELNFEWQGGVAVMEAAE